MKRLSLSTRVTLLLGVAAILILGAAALTMDHMVDAEMGRRMDDGLLTQARALESLVAIGADGLDMDERERQRPHLLTGKAATFWAVRCGRDGRARSQPPPPDYPADWVRSARSQPQFVNVQGGDGLMRAVWFRVAAGDDAAASASAISGGMCSILFMRPRGELDDILTTIDGILLLIPLLAVVAVLLLAPVLVRRGLKPMAMLGDAMQGIGPQSPGRRLHATGTRELEPLVARFNDVLTRMDEGVARERQFAGALAHETRTHLAELRTLIEVEQHYPSGRPLADMLGEIGGIVGELQGTVSGLLLLTRLQAGIEAMVAEEVRLGEVVQRHLASLETAQHERRLRLVPSTTGHEVVVVADRALLDIVIGNLFTNAVAYAPEGSVLGVHWRAQALVVENDAPDVAGQDVARFGQRFWSKHHGADGHSGLGLALAGAAAAAMHFNLHFVLDVHQRLHVTLAWPRDLEVG